MTLHLRNKKLPKFRCDVCTFKTTWFFAFPDDYWLIDFTTIGTNEKSNCHSLLLLFSTFTFILFLYKNFGRKCFDKTATFIHIPYIFHNSLSRSVQEPTVTAATSKDSPDICFSRMP